MRRLGCVLAVFLWLTVNAGAETVQLKSGPSVEGAILERNADVLRLDVGGTVLTFDADEIVEVSGGTDLTQEAAAPSSVAAAERLAAEKGAARHFLWEVRGKGPAVMYLFGSIHLGRADMYPLADPIERAFDRADALVVEVDVNAIDEQEASRMALAKGTLSEGDSLQKHISAPVWARLLTALSRYGIPAAAVTRFQPWLLSITLTQAQLESLGFSPDQGVDRYFLRRSGVSGGGGPKTVLELETLDQQLDFLSGIQNQGLLLAYTLETMDDTERLFTDMLAAWQDGDADRLQKIMIEDLHQKNPELDPMVQTLLYDRNITMADRLEDMLAADRVYFVVVGAGHLVGSRGIPARLREAGYTVDQL